MCEPAHLLRVFLFKCMTNNLMGELILAQCLDSALQCNSDEKYGGYQTLGRVSTLVSWQEDVQRLGLL